MSNQSNVIGKIGPFLVRGGFKSNNSPRYPEDRLITFLNVNPRNKKEVVDFCSDYNLVPRNLTKGLVSGFIKEQKEIRTMAIKIIDDSLALKDLRKFNLIINKITLDIRKNKIDELHLISSPLRGSLAPARRPTRCAPKLSARKVAESN